MSPAEDAASPADSASGRRGRRQLGWTAVLCFGSRRARGEEALAAGTTQWEWPRPGRGKRTVPVDGEVVARPADPEVRRGDDNVEVAKGLRLGGCCFLPPARAPGRKHSSIGSGDKTHHKQQLAEKTAEQQADTTNPPSEAPAARQFQVTAGNNNNGNRSRRAEQPRVARAREARRPPARTPPTAPRDTAAEDVASVREPRTDASDAGGQYDEKASAGAFGPAVGLSVVAAVSMAGLLRGRLWAVACLCAWLVALSGLRRRGARVLAGDGGKGEEVVGDVDSTDYKKLVALRGLLQRDREKAVVS